MSGLTEKAALCLFKWTDANIPSSLNKAKATCQRFRLASWGSPPKYNVFPHRIDTIPSAPSLRSRTRSAVKFFNSKSKYVSPVPPGSRSVSTGQNEPKDNEEKPLPRLLYIQNPLVWFSNKLDFRFLRVTWDPTFNEAEFLRGARQAVSTVTKLVSKNTFEDLKPLVTKTAFINLRRDAEILWSDEVRRNLSLDPSDVQVIIPRKLHFRSFTDKKFCDIDVVFIGLKHLQSRNVLNPPIIFIDIIARFHRNYTEGVLPEWTISAFKVRRFNVIPSRAN